MSAVLLPLFVTPMPTVRTMSDLMFVRASRDSLEMGSLAAVRYANKLLPDKFFFLFILCMLYFI